VHCEPLVRVTARLEGSQVLLIGSTWLQIYYWS
jgi:hypothetical protein